MINYLQKLIWFNFPIPLLTSTKSAFVNGEIIGVG